MPNLTTPTKATTGKQVNPVQVPQYTSCKAHLESCMHVHQPMSQVCKPGESPALRKVKHPLNGRTSVSRLPLTKQDILSQYSGCFEGIGCFSGDPIGRSRGHRGMCAPQQDQFLSFSHTFLPKSVRIGGWCPPNGLAPPPMGNPGSATGSIQISPQARLQACMTCTKESSSPP